MAISITMPRLSDTMEQGTVVKWHVSTGDAVSAGDVIADIETDKATMELESFDDGTVAALAVEEGKSIAVGQPIVILAEDGESVEDAAKQITAPASSASSNTAQNGGSDAGTSSPSATAVADPPASTNGSAASNGQRVFVSPLARKIAEENNINLGAITGTDFGTVMRMVAEEVWLKTNGRQRPWVNESLRRLLYFGEAPAVPEGPQGDLVNERRRLLITIAELPEFGRARVERIAQQNGVPMDALFGLLNAMGAEAPGDPARLEEVLKQESLRIRKILEDRAALESGDPEVARRERGAVEHLVERVLVVGLVLALRHEPVPPRPIEFEQR